MGPLRDCEAIADIFWGQPINTLTTLAFIGAGIVVVRRPPIRWVGVALIATGIGSFLFHGPMPPFSEWAHDVSLAWLLLVAAAAGRSWQRWANVPGVVALGLLFIGFPALADPVAALLAIVAVGLILARDRSVATTGPLLLLGTVAVIGRLGATGGPLCRPDAFLQPHAIWHLGAAAAAAWWALGSVSTSELEPVVADTRT